MKKRFAIFKGGDNCWANKRPGTRPSADAAGNAEYRWACFIDKESTFETEAEALTEATRLNLGKSVGISILPVYVN